MYDSRTRALLIAAAPAAAVAAVTAPLAATAVEHHPNSALAGAWVVAQPGALDTVKFPDRAGD
jgi:hypothetical protein